MVDLSCLLYHLISSRLLVDLPFVKLNRRPTLDRVEAAVVIGDLIVLTAEDFGDAGDSFSVSYTQTTYDSAYC